MFKDSRGRLISKTRGNGYYGGVGDIFNFFLVDFCVNKIFYMVWYLKEDIIVIVVVNFLYFFFGGFS